MTELLTHSISLFIINDPDLSESNTTHSILISGKAKGRISSDDNYNVNMILEPELL